jgi:alpha-mannosidase
MDDSFDRMANHKADWELVENGPVRAVYQLEQPLGGATVRQRLVVWNEGKRLDCDVDLLKFSGRLWREFRLALPLAFDRPKITYEVPFGVVQIGKDEIPMTGGHAYGGLDYYQECRDIHPREVQDFVDASDDRGGLTMSSSGSVFDWIDPTTNASADTILQPVLLASRKSCNGAGVWYPQAGDHHFQFAISSHSRDWRNNWHDGVAANHPFQTVVGAPPRIDAQLPESYSFFSLSGTNLAVSTIKKCEDNDSIVVRVYDIEGIDTKPSLTTFLNVGDAKHANIIEQEDDGIDFKGREVRLTIGHNAIETFVIDFGKDLRSSPRQ